MTCSARTGQGVADVVAALARAAVRVRSRTSTTTPVVLHADRVFTMRGAGTVLTGTLWSGTIGRGDMLSLLPAGRGLRVCGVHVHGEAVAQAAAGERVAVNLAGVAVPSVSRGDALASPDAPVRVTRVWTSRSRWRRPPARPPGVSRSITPRAPWPGAWSRWPAATGNSGSSNPCSSPTATGSSSVGSPRMTRSAGGSCSTHERGVTVPGPTCSSALRRIERGENPDSAAPAARPEPVAVRRVAPRPLSPGAVALAGRLRASGHEPPTRAQLGDDARHLEALRAAGVAVRIGRDMYAHADAIGEVRARVSAIIRAEGAITLARLRDELHTSRRFAQALLEHLDADRLTHRRPDNSRVLRRGRKTLSDLCTGFLTKRNLTIALQQHQRAERRW